MNDQLGTLLILAGPLLLIGVIMRYVSIKKNPVFGYRTKRSMKSKENGAFANKKTGLYFIYTSLFSLLLGGLSVVYEFHIKFVMIPTVVLLLLTIVVVEIELRRFDKNHPKKEETTPPQSK